ncbi:MAG TPA: SMI1/KNR4 family protein [Hanamia sp.]|nr:SMI1/KNR4 family protein [Hanamia sp.]
MKNKNQGTKFESMTKDILDPLKTFQYLGEILLSDGTLLIGKAPHIAPNAWLHCIYAALSNEDINSLENNFNLQVPGDFKSFLEISNGLGIFNTTFSLYGLRRNYKRNEDDVWQPFNIVTTNTFERPFNSKSEFFFIGGYDWDGSLLYINSKTNEVHLCEREDATSIYTWVNFECMLKSEIKRLMKLFDKSGKELNPSESTLPIK